jgi:alpha-galactosidase
MFTRCGYDLCTASEIMNIADAMSTNGMRELGYEYINLDDCWANYRDENGTIVPDKSRFPDGLVPVIEYINSKGLKFGLYTDAGIHTCNKGERLHEIPGSYGHYEQDSKTYASWGVEFVKMDWCSTDINGTKLDPKVQYPEMARALNRTGKRILFNSCEWGVDDPWTWMRPYANAWRSGPDHHDKWLSTTLIIELNHARGVYAGPGGWNDFDFLMTGGQGCINGHRMEHCPGQTDAEYRTEFSIWSIAASNLLVATDIRNMTDIMKQILLNKEIIEVNQDYPGKGGNRIAYSNCTEGPTLCQIWAKPLSDSTYAVGLYNAGEEDDTVYFDLKMLNFTTAIVAVRDLWQHQDLGIFTGFFSADVGTHDTAMYKMTPVNY